MPGIGKTTFALKLYNHLSVKYGFHTRAWCTISQVLDKKRVFLQLLKQIQPVDYSKMTEDDLANKLRQSLKGMRYLVLLDDVWTPQVWDSLRASFPDDGIQSRILLTSRLQAIVPFDLPDEQPYSLRLRNENECLEILKMKLLHKAVGFSTELGKFANFCNGLPLTAVLVAGLLATKEQQGWEGILDQFSFGGMSQMKRCKIVLDLSYKQLPDELKHCFIYFGVFPEDEEIYANKLIGLWMAEGFVAGNIDLFEKKIEDVAREYLDSLIQRNLVTVVKQRSTGGVKTCQIHDLLHGFCLMKGNQENRFHILKQRKREVSEFNEPSNLERLSIHSTPIHFKESRLLCPLARSMLFFIPTWNEKEYFQLPDMSFIIQTYKRLRVLDMEQILFSAGIPSEIAQLTWLTFLSIGCGTPVIPSSIGKLSNLETLIIEFFVMDTVSLPHTIWNLQKLRCMSITNSLYEGPYPCFSFPIEDHEISPNLLELESLSRVDFYSDGKMAKQMMKFPNIRRLKCNILWGEEDEVNEKVVVVPEFCSKLESLDLCTKYGFIYQFDFDSSAESLRKVKLEGFLLSREEIAVIGKLPNLEVLMLSYISFPGDTMEMEEGEFSMLRILLLDVCHDLETWTAELMGMSNYHVWRSWHSAIVVN